MNTKTAIENIVHKIISEVKNPAFNKRGTIVVDDDVKLPGGIWLRMLTVFSLTFLTFASGFAMNYVVIKSIIAEWQKLVHHTGAIISTFFVNTLREVPAFLTHPVVLTGILGLSIAGVVWIEAGIRYPEKFH